MNHLFVPYEESLELKELGFDEPCLGYFNTTSYLGIGSFVFKECNKNTIDSYGNKPLLRPTFSQAFKWFREKHNLRSFVDTRVYSVDTPNQWIYDYQVKMGNGIDTEPYYSGDFDTYEEAELECLKKLIQITKNK